MLAIVYLTDSLLRTIDDVLPCQFCALFRGSVLSYFALIGTYHFFILLQQLNINIW